MLRNLALASVLGVLAIAAAPGISGAAPPVTPTFKDSAVGTGSTNVFSAFDFNVTGGPAGENPSGFSSVDGFGEHFVGTAITCLQVNGNTATFAGPLAPNLFGIPYGKVTVVDNGTGAGVADTYSAAGYYSPPTCDVPSNGGAGSLQTGNITVVDSSAPPTSRGDCLEDGYSRFGFATVGLCIAYVERPVG